MFSWIFVLSYEYKPFLVFRSFIFSVILRSLLKINDQVQNIIGCY